MYALYDFQDGKGFVKTFRYCVMDRCWKNLQKCELVHKKRVSHAISKYASLSYFVSEGKFKKQHQETIFQKLRKEVITTKKNRA